jgi:hypothetical protein
VTDTLVRSGPEAPAAPMNLADVCDLPWQKRIDRLLLIGSLLCGTMVFAAPGLFVLWRAYRLHKEGLARGEQLRPAIISIVAVTCLVDAFVNFLIWSVDLFPTHDTVLGHTLYTGLGQLFDGAYNLGYNTTAMGGTAIASEKALEVAGALMLYPMRLVAAWGFLRMRRWGHQYLMVNNWVYVFFWMTYIAAFSHEYSWRFPHTLFGTALIWSLYIFFAYPFLMIPFQHLIYKRHWIDKE